MDQKRERGERQRGRGRKEHCKGRHKARIQNIRHLILLKIIESFLKFLY